MSMSSWENKQREEHISEESFLNTVLLLIYCFIDSYKKW